MRKSGQRALSLSSYQRSAIRDQPTASGRKLKADKLTADRFLVGLTLIELLVTLVILSILAAAALPYAETTIRREKELELRRALRDIRTAIDAFNEDWKSGKIPKTASVVSDDGYPKTLQTLIDGAETSEAKGGKRKYLRRIPRDPFADSAKPPEEQWVLRGYQDERDSIMWGGRDVYDIRSASDATALDSTRYKDW